jgi:hypothetical protein
MKQVKTEQQKEGESLSVNLAKLLFTGKLIVRSGTVSDDLIDRGSKRVTFFVKENKNDE